MNHVLLLELSPIVPVLAAGLLSLRHKLHPDDSAVSPDQATNPSAAQLNPPVLFGPALTVMELDLSDKSAKLTLKNIGSGRALGITALYYGGTRQILGDLHARGELVFPFLSGTGVQGRMPLRFEYAGANGARRWSMVIFRFEGNGPVGVEETTHGICDTNRPAQRAAQNQS